MESVPDDLDRDGFRVFVAAQRPRWQREATQALELIASLPDNG